MSQRCKIAEMTLAEAALQRIIEIGFIVLEFVLGSRACHQLSQMTAAAKWIAARKFLAVLS
jgi:hypothetical protein